MKRRLLFLLLSAFLSLPLFAYDFKVNGIYYNINSGTSTCSVTYGIKSYNSYSGDIVIPSTVTYGGNEYSVTEIDEYAFWECTKLTSMTIPNSVTTIVEYTFYGCNSLREFIVENNNSKYASRDGVLFNKNMTTLIRYPQGKVVETYAIPNSVTTIGNSAFYCCSSLTSVTIPHSVTEIGGGAFSNCSGLTSVTIPNSVTEIGAGAFYNCSRLTEIIIPNSVMTIGNSAFSNCSGLTSVTIGNSVTEIGESAFERCSVLTSVTISSSVIKIGSDAFYDCNRLKEVHISDIAAWCKINFLTETSNPLLYAEHLFLKGEEVIDLVIPNSVTTIGSRAFSNCSGLTSVTIPNSVTEIGDYAFVYCSGLISVNIPNSVTKIGNYAFYNCSGLTLVTIPNSVTEIGSYAFSNCSGLTSLTFNAKNCTSCGSLGDPVFPSSITSLTIGNEVTKIPAYFLKNGSEITAITIPNSVTSIGDYAFYRSTHINSLTLGSGLISIGNYAFSYYSYNNNSNITIAKVFWLGNTPPSNYNAITARINYVSSDQYSSLSNVVKYKFLSSKFMVDGVVYVPVSPSDRTCDVIDCDYYLQDDNIIINDKVTNQGIDLKVLNINDYAFFSCNYISAVLLGNSIISIGKYAFADCSSLHKITIPDNVASIGDYIFSGCSNLSSLNLGLGISTIPTNAFSGCSALDALSLPDNIKEIEEYAFKGCTSLSNLRFEDAKTSDDNGTILKLGSNGSNPLFSDCPLEEVYIGRKLSYNTSSGYGYSPFYRSKSLRRVEITDAETKIYDNEFYGCTNLKTLKIGNGVETIGNWAFSGCSSLDYFSAGCNVESIGTEAFSDCTGLKKYYSFSPVPPICGSQALDDINKWNCVLYVPEECSDEYMAADQWKDFFFINETSEPNEEDPEVVINTIESVENAPLEIYNLSGVKVAESVDGLPRGIYIVRQGAQTTKVSI